MDWTYPRCSPDGSKILFSSFLRNDGYLRNERGLFTMDSTTGANIQHLVSGSSNDYSNPEWSPDSTKIVFTRGSSFYVMNADGSNEVALAGVTGTPAFHPQWSPDGNWIAFDVSGGDIDVIKPDGSGRMTVLESGLVMDWMP
jgi:Tol biopolymer transport system component